MDTTPRPDDDAVSLARLLRHPVKVPPPGSEFERLVAAAQRRGQAFELDGRAREIAAELGLPEEQAKLFFRKYAFLLLLLEPPVKY